MQMLAIFDNGITNVIHVCNVNVEPLEAVTVGNHDNSNSRTDFTRHNGVDYPRDC